MKLLLCLIALAATLSCTKRLNSQCANGVCFNQPMQDQTQPAKPEAPVVIENQVPPKQIAQSGEQPKVGVSAEQLIMDCTKKAEDYLLTEEQVSRICLQANEYSENCMTRAFDLEMLRDDVTAVCEHAKKGTVACIVAARNNDKYSEEIPDVCKQ